MQQNSVVKPPLLMVYTAAMIDLNEYEEVTKMGAVYTMGLMRIWEKLGKPNDCSTNAGWIVLDQVVAVWQKAFPQEVTDWIHDRKDDLLVERSVREHVKGGGYNPVTYPPSFFLLLKSMLPDQKLTDKKFQKALCERHPIFKSTNLAL